MGSALHHAEQALCLRISGRIPAGVAAHLLTLIAHAGDEHVGEVDERDSPEVFATIKADPGNISLKTARDEVGKLTVIRAIGVASTLFAEVAPKAVSSWRARAAVEAPSHLQRHPQPIRLTLLAALVYCREREITDTLVDLLIATVGSTAAPNAGLSMSSCPT